MKKKHKIQYFAVEDLKQLTINDVFKHVQLLYKQILKQRKKIKKLQLKIKKMTFLSKLDAQLSKIQTQEEEITPQEATEQENSNVLDFVNEIKNTALTKSYEQAGFVYEPKSGLYWDSKNQLYYSAEYDLYYNGNEGNWYRLNPITNEFTFHSATEASKAAKKNEVDEEEAIRKILEEGRQTTITAKEDSEKKLRSRRSSSDSSSSGSSSRSDSGDRRRRRRRRSRSRSYSRRNRSRSRSRSRNRRRKSHSRSRREDGECDTTNSEDERKAKESRDNIQWKRKKKKRKGNDYEEIAKKYPPSLRLIVIESKFSKIPIGKLYVVTYKGGTLGREGDHHHVLLPVEEVSKEHLKFYYNNKKGCYQFTEKSRNGTLLNGKQVSLKNQEECEPQTLLHDDVLEIGRVKLLAHMHEGLSTCHQCETFNYQQQKPHEQQATKSTSDDLLPSTLSHKEQLKLLQKRYGLQSEKYQEKPTGASNSKYEDRASQRRKKVGSSHDHEKTVHASVDQSISSENKGFKMLAKMGWSEGSSIGKSDLGIKEPVQVKTQTGTIGLGHESAASSSYSNIGENKKKKEIWSKTQERYNKLKGKND